MYFVTHSEFDLHHFNHFFLFSQVHRYVFRNLKNGVLKSIQLYVKDGMDSYNNAIVKRSLTTTTYALILLHQSKFLIQYSLLENRARKLSLIIPLSNGLHDVLIAAEITIKNNDELIIKDHSNGLWMAKLSKIKHSIKSKDVELFVEVQFLGSLLGAAKAIAIPSTTDDIDQYLYYYLPRDGAVVRWNFRYVIFYGFFYINFSACIQKKSKIYIYKVQ